MQQKRDQNSEEDSYNFEFYERLNRKEQQQERIRQKQRRRNRNYHKKGQDHHQTSRHRSKSSDSSVRNDKKKKKHKSHKHKRQRSSSNSHENMTHIRQVKKSRSRSRSREKEYKHQKQEIIPSQIHQSSRPRLKINGGFLSSLILDNKISNRRLDEQDITRTGQKLQKSFNESRRPVTMSEYLSNQTLRVMPIINLDALLSKKHKCEMDNCNKEFEKVEQLQKHLQKHKEEL